MLESKIALSGGCFEFFAENTNIRPPREYVESAVCAATVDHHNLGRPIKWGQRTRDVRRLVVRQQHWSDGIEHQQACGRAGPLILLYPPVQYRDPGTCLYSLRDPGAISQK